MDNVYDFWGRLVQAVLREDRIRQDALRDFSSCTDDSSSTTTDAAPDHIFSSGRFIPSSSIDDLQKGMLQGGGSSVSVHEGINSDGLCFAVKEISLQDQGEESQEIIDQLEQEISLLSQLEHENILPNGSSSDATIEKHLPNGDLYIGTFSGSAPHGLGKYLWTDGCVYEGEWKRGKASGKGKFSWPSGATFEGEFKSGRMEGSGTLIGPDGDTYRGTWSADRKHGYGVKHYSNGDYYKGHWKRNLQNGQGRYVWKNGKEYIGEWKNGVSHGRGALVWANGNRYDGYWETSVPKGRGIFTWPDGSCYIGCWIKDSKNQHNQVLNGTFYPAHNNTNSHGNFSSSHGKMEGFGGLFSTKLSAPLLMDENFGGMVVAMGTGKKRSSVDDARGSLTEKKFPRILIWESDGETGNITCDIIDDVEASILYRDGLGFDGDGIKQFRRNPCCFSGEVKKPGQTISKGEA